MTTPPDPYLDPASSEAPPDARNLGLYDDPTVYDVLHAGGTSDEVRGLIEVERRFVKPERSMPVWLEPACGTGRYLRQAAAKGRRVVGFDLDAGMVAYAERRLAKAGLGARSHVFVADMTEFAGHIRQPVDLAFNLINTIRHLATDDAMLAHFAEISRVLAPGGVYVVGLGTAMYGGESESEDVWESARGGLRVRQIVQYIPAMADERMERVISHLVIETPKGEEHRDDAYTLRSYTLDEWRELIGRSRLEIVGVVDESGADVEPPACGYAWYVLGRRD